MNKRLTIADMTARAEALEECADHLDLDWTDDATERKAGNWLAKRLLNEAIRWRLRAANNRDQSAALARSNLAQAIARAGDY